MRRFAAVLSAVAVAGSLLLAAPAIATPRETASPAAPQQNSSFDGQRISFRPVQNQGFALAFRPAVFVVERADESNSQTFVPDRLPNGYYVLRHGDQFLRWGFLTSLDLVSGNAATDPRAQWQFDRQSNGTYAIRSRDDSSAALSWNTFGSAVVVRTDDNAATNWVVSPIGGALVDGANYAFAWQINTFYTLDVEGAPTVSLGARARLTPWGGFPSQWWRVRYNPEFGTYWLMNLNALNLALEQNMTTHHAALQYGNFGPAQQWTVRPGQRGGWELINLATAVGAGDPRIRALDNHNSVSANARVDVNPYTGSAGQEWEIVGPRR